MTMSTQTLPNRPRRVSVQLSAGLPNLTLHGASATQVTEFAFAELRRFLDKTPAPGKPRDIQFEIRPGPRDAFEFAQAPGDRLRVIAANDRSCLYAAYAILQSLGWRFAVPGEDHLDAPSPDRWKALLGRTEASFEWRGLSLSSPDTRELLAVIDWMPKVRMNSLFVGHNGNIEQSLAVMAELKRRGIRLDTGGHIFKDFLPAKLFDPHPEYFRMKENVRRRDGNFCTADPQTLRILAENAVDYARKLPDAQVFHFWGDDVEGGSWCECPRCRKHSPDEQLMAASNAVAAALAVERPGARVDFLLYHDTIEIVDPLKPAGNIFACYAPRERCYAHALGDPACARNVWYSQCLERAHDIFGSRITVFEYYNTFMLWRCLGVAMPATILADLHYYKSKGIEDVQTLHFGQITNWAYPLNTYVFARSAWDASLTRDALVSDFCRDRYGSEQAPILISAVRALEEATMQAITYCGYDKHAYDLRDVPLAPADFAAQHRLLVEQAISTTCQALEKLAFNSSDAIARDRLMLELNRDNLRALLHQMRNEFDPAIALLTDLRRRMSDRPDLLGGWAEAPRQFQMIAELLESAKAGRRHRDW